jgi:hypothetical protein
MYKKTLDFTNIDKYHGTGAFNQTTFPQWDSIFLDYVNRPEEIIVMSVKQRQRRRSSLSGRNDYLEDMSKSSNTPTPPSSASQLPKNANKPTTRSTPRRGITGSYLDSLSSSGGGVDNTPREQQQPPPPKPASPPTLKGSAGSYLESLSNPAMSSIPEEDKKPMGEIKNNPYVEEVGFLFLCYCILCLITTLSQHNNIIFHSLSIHHAENDRI